MVNAKLFPRFVENRISFSLCLSLSPSYSLPLYLSQFFFSLCWIGRCPTFSWTPSTFDEVRISLFLSFYLSFYLSLPLFAFASREVSNLLGNTRISPRLARLRSFYISLLSITLFLPLSPFVEKGREDLFLSVCLPLSLSPDRFLDFISEMLNFHISLSPSLSLSFS